ncbi:MAG: AAA family ATPase [Bacteroidetes bacterium]|nr:AAA family ATPase [Bacteroidota bacterium]
MISLAGLPGSGKSTLLQQLGIEDQFTNCNIDNFYEPYLKNELGTSDLHTPTDSYVNFKRKVDEVCSLGANFIIDGTSANYGKTSKDLQLYLDAGYDCAMIMVDIDVETSQSRNLERGKKDKRSIWNPIIYRQSKSMTPNIEKYAQLFGPDRFFLVSNRGTFGEFKEAIEAKRPGVQAFMESR